MTSPLEDFDIIYQGRIEPLQRCVSAVATFGQSADGRRPVIYAHAVMDKIIVCGVAKVVLQQLLGIEGYSPEHLALAATEMRATVLTSPGLPTSEQNQDETRRELP